MSSLYGTMRFLINFVAKDNRPIYVIRWYQGRLKNSYKILERSLEKRDWLVGDTVTLVDLSFCGYLYYPEPFGFIRNDWPNIDSWLERISNLENWKHPYELMPGNPLDHSLSI